MVKDRTYVDIIFTTRNVCISNGSCISIKSRYNVMTQIIAKDIVVELLVCRRYPQLFNVLPGRKLFPPVG